MSIDLGDEDTVLDWAASRWVTTAEAYQRLQPLEQNVMGYLITSSHSFNGGLPAIYINENAFGIPGAIACLQAIELDSLAVILQEYRDAIQANPYLGPPEIWPRKVAPVGSQPETEKERIDQLDERWHATIEAVGVSTIWNRLARYIKVSAPDT